LPLAAGLNLQRIYIASDWSVVVKGIDVRVTCAINITVPKEISNRRNFCAREAHNLAR
jgi:hypothetical protein